MIASEALFAAARALRETRLRQVFGITGSIQNGEACAGLSILSAEPRFPLEEMHVRCPKCDRGLCSIIIHLNDAHRMSFAAIAEYLETLAVQEAGK